MSFVFPKPSSSQLRQLEAGESILVSVPCTPDTCTVLGYDVTPRSPIWKQLDFDRDVMIDGSFSQGKCEYMHVAARFCGGNDWGAYRVRPKPELGDRVSVKGVKGKLTVKTIKVAGRWDGLWWWRYELERVNVGRKAVK